MGGGSSKQNVPKGHKTVPVINVSPARAPATPTPLDESKDTHGQQPKDVKTSKDYFDVVKGQLQNKKAHELSENGVLVLGHKSYMRSVCEINTEKYTRQYIYALIHKNDSPNLARLLRYADVGYAVLRNNTTDTVNQESGTRCKSCEIEFTNLFKIGEEDGEQDFWSAEGKETEYIEELEWWMDAKRETYLNADIEKDIKENYNIFFAIERSLCESPFDLLGKIHSAVVTPQQAQDRLKHSF